MAKNIENKEYKEKVLKISRVSKTTTGGRTISFSVLAAVGDKNGKIGIGLGKANGVPDAIRKAIAKAKKNDTPSKQQADSLTAADEEDNGLLPCPQCGKKTLRPEGRCFTCSNCLWTKCD